MVKRQLHRCWAAPAVQPYAPAAHASLPVLGHRKQLAREVSREAQHACQTPREAASFSGSREFAEVIRNFTEFASGGPQIRLPLRASATGMEGGQWPGVACELIAPTSNMVWSTCKHACPLAAPEPSASPSTKTPTALETKLCFLHMYLYLHTCDIDIHPYVYV